MTRDKTPLAWLVHFFSPLIAAKGPFATTAPRKSHNSLVARPCTQLAWLDCSIHSRRSDVEHLSYLSNGQLPFVIELLHLLLLHHRELWLAATETPPSPGRRRGGNHREEEFALWGLRVDVLLGHFKLDAPLLEL